MRVWDQIRPLIFINACHSAELDPAALFNYIDVFVGAANAAGVVGTEVKVSQDLAMEFARRFFDELLSPGGTVGPRYAGPDGVSFQRQPLRAQLHSVLLGGPDHRLVTAQVRAWRVAASEVLA